MFHEELTTTTKMVVLLSEPWALPSGLEALRAGSGDGVEPEAWRPRASAPATYRSGTVRLRSRIFDYIDDIELNSSPFAICSLVPTNFSENFHSAICIPHSAIVDTDLKLCLVDRFRRFC